MLFLAEQVIQTSQYFYVESICFITTYSYIIAINIFWSLLIYDMTILVFISLFTVNN